MNNTMLILGGVAAAALGYVLIAKPSAPMMPPATGPAAPTIPTDLTGRMLDLWQQAGRPMDEFGWSASVRPALSAYLTDDKIAMLYRLVIGYHQNTGVWAGQDLILGWIKSLAGAN